jgi:Icc-related predicted phosphoesterase
MFLKNGTALRILLFSDVHCSEPACHALVEKSLDVNFVIGAGDLAHVRRGLDISISILKAIDKPTILVPGNNESERELQTAIACWDAAVVLHGSGIEICDIPFYGIGGGIPVTPFGDWSYDFSEREARAMLSDLPSGAILVSHSPPQGCVDVSSSGVSLGSASVREAIIDKHPLLVVCGHIHESAGRHAMLGRTPVVNAGPGGVVWNLDTSE